MYKYSDTGVDYKSKSVSTEVVKSIVEDYPYYLNKELVCKYNTTKNVITSIAIYYELKKDKDAYNEKMGRITTDDPVDLIMFDWFYPKTTGKQMRLAFKKSERYLKDLAKSRGLVKDEWITKLRRRDQNTRLTYLVTGDELEMDGLKEEDVKYIKNNFSKESNVDIKNKLNCSLQDILIVSRYYNLKKDKKLAAILKREMLIERNKNIIGRDLSIDALRTIALSYQTKREFSEKDPSAYTTANKLGVMEDITKHMVATYFSVPQIILRQITEKLLKTNCEYNTRKVIKPYELDIYYENLKLAFEYDGEGWHKNDVVDKLKLCQNKEILLITVSERSRNFLEDIQTYLIENLEKINSWCNVGLTIHDILSFNDPIDFPKLFTDEELNICRSNDTKFLRKNHLKLYEKYKRYNPDNKIFTCKKWDLDSVSKGLSKYSSVSELRKNDKNLYNIIYKKFRHLLPLYNN